MIAARVGYAYMVIGIITLAALLTKPADDPEQLKVSARPMPRAYIAGFSSTENFIAEVRMSQR